jgi:hypothetical protein
MASASRWCVSGGRQQAPRVFLNVVAPHLVKERFTIRSTKSTSVTMSTESYM